MHFVLGGETLSLLYQTVGKPVLYFRENLKFYYPRLFTMPAYLKRLFRTKTGSVSNFKKCRYLKYLERTAS